MKNYERLSVLLREYRLRKKLSQDELSKRVGVHQSSITLYENPNSDRWPKFENLVKICEILDLSDGEREELLTIAGVTKFKQSTIDMLRINKGELRRIPILTGVQASHFQEAIAHELDDHTQYIYTESRDKDSFAMRVVGDCMETEFNEGDIITVSPNADVNHGDYAIFQENGNHAVTFKQFKKYGDQVILHPLNPKYQDIEVRGDVKIVGRVISKTKVY
jgi:repressor LexA